MKETAKAFERRKALGWFDKYILGNCIDIGCGRLESVPGEIIKLTDNCTLHDKDMCDAHYMDWYIDEFFDTVHASHVLEHLEHPGLAIQNWWRILKKGGHLIISVPDRDLYERQLELPSRWNTDHKSMFIKQGEPNAWTYELKWLVLFAIGEKYPEDKPEVVYYEIANTCTNAADKSQHGDGEYSIEIIVKKNG